MLLRILHFFFTFVVPAMKQVTTTERNDACEDAGNIFQMDLKPFVGDLQTAFMLLNLLL